MAQFTTFNLFAGGSTSVADSAVDVELRYGNILFLDGLRCGTNRYVVDHLPNTGQLICLPTTENPIATVGTGHDQRVEVKPGAQRMPLRLSCGSHDAPAGGHFDPLQTRTAGTGFWCSHLYTSA